MTTLDQTEILWDKYKNVPNAYPGSSFLANQAVGDAFPQIVPNNQTWSSQIPATAPTDLGSVVTFTNGSYRQSVSYPWIRKYTVTMGAIQAPGISYWYASTNVNSPLTTNVCRETIPFNFDPLGSYNIQVFANGVAVSPTFTAYPWNYDESAGVLTFYPASFGVLPPTPITFTYWRYVGTKGGGAALSYWTIEDPSPGSLLYFSPSTGTAANIYLTNSAEWLLAGPGNGYSMYDRTNTNAYWTTYSTANVLTFSYNSGTPSIKGSLNSSGNLSITSLTVGGTQNITLSSSRTTFSGGNGISVQSGISVGTAYASSGIVGISGILNAGTTNFFEIYDSTITNIIYRMNSTGIITTLPITAPNFTGTASTSTAITTTTQPAATTYFLTMSSSGTGGTSRSIFVDSGITYNNGTDTLTATNFTGSLTGSATLIDTTAVGTNAVYYIPFVPIGASSQPNGQVLGTDAGLTYNPGNNNTFEVVNGIIKTVNEIISNSLFMLDTVTPANYFQIYHNNGTLIFDNYWSTFATPLEVNGNGLGVTTYNIKAQAYAPTTAVQLDSPSIRDANNQGVLYEANTANDYSSIPTQTGTRWSIVVDGNNPNSRELTFSFGVSSLQDLIVNSSSGASQSFAPTFNTVTATRNGGAFTAFSYITNIASTTSFAYTPSTANPASYRIRQPLTQYTIKFIPTNSLTTDTYVFTIGITMNYTAGAGYSWTNTSIERNPTNFAYSFTQLTGLILIPQLVPVAPAGTSMISAKTLTKDFAQVSSRTLACDFLQAEYVNLCGEYTLTGTSGTLLRCFRGNYAHYEIQLRFTSVPTQGTQFRVLLAFANGTVSFTGYLGSLSSTGTGLTFLSYGTTTGAILFSVAGNNVFNDLVYTAKIYNPNIARCTTFQAMNIGSDGTNVNVPFLSTGYHTVATAYESLRWTTTNSINASILFRGFN
jgi:hypothetical protein